MCIKRKKSISFLLGAGFSVPANYYIASKLSDKILHCTDDDIFVNSCGLICKKEYGNVKAYDEYFEYLIRLQKIYNVIYGNFNYEAFYDFIKSKHSEKCSFLKELSKAVGIKGCGTSMSNTFEQIDDIYNQIVAYYLNNDPNITKYSNFKTVVSSLEADYDVNVHTLNHDLLFEKLFWDKYSDGFSFDLTFNYCKQPIRILKYNGEYHCKNKIALYKLHGSIDHYMLYRTFTDSMVIMNSNHPDYIKIPNNINISQLKGENDELIYKLHPDFLTGIEYKQTRYKEEFYNDLQGKYISNLITADKLIIIGYSGNDDGINKHLNKLNPNATCFVLDYSEEDAKKVIDRIGLCDKGIRCYAVKSELENVKESDFEESTYRN